MISTRPRKSQLDCWKCYEMSFVSSDEQDIELDINIKYIPNTKVLHDLILDTPQGNLDEIANDILNNIQKDLDAKYVEIKIEDDLGHKIFVNKYFEEDWKEFSNYRFAEVLI